MFLDVITRNIAKGIDAGTVPAPTAPRATGAGALGGWGPILLVGLLLVAVTR
jgi:hypothetical protein